MTAGEYDEIALAVFKVTPTAIQCDASAQDTELSLELANSLAFGSAKVEEKSVNVHCEPTNVP